MSLCIAQSVRKESFPFSFIVGLLRVYSLVPLARTPTAFVFLFLLLVAYNKSARPLILLGCLLAVVNALVTWTFAHYLAPLIALCWILFFSLLGNLRSLRFRRILVGPWLVLVCLGVSFPGSIAENANYLTDLKEPTPTGRQLIQTFLESQPENHLVLIRRHQPYILNDEWVYDDANIEQSRILWVRDLDEKSNQALFRNYPGRRIWLCEPEIVPLVQKLPA